MVPSYRNNEGEPNPTVPVAASPRVGELVADALRYWEPRRLLYNLVLAVVVVAHFLTSWPTSKSFLVWNNVLGLFVLAVLANVCYCAAYVVDLFVQLSGSHASWARWRWLLLVIGILFGAVLAHFFSIGRLSRSW